MTGLPNSLAARDIASLIHPYTNLEKHKTDGPMVIARGDGVYVHDETGKRYLEGMAGLWSTSLGFSEKRLVEAARRQMEQLPTYHMFNSRSTEPSIEAAEELLKIVPKGLGKVLFANSGSEANDQAAKIVWFYNNALGRPRKKRIIGRVRGYHGITVFSGSMTGLAANHNEWDLPIGGVLRTDCPSHYLYGRPGETEAQFVDRLVANLEDMIVREGPDTIGAFIAEPVNGAGGVIVPPLDYFPRIQQVLRKYDVLMIADEVICGFGRTGEMFGCDTFGIEPDIMTVAKALSSAYLPISAVLLSPELVEIIEEEAVRIGGLWHAFTYSAHPVAAAVAVKTLEIYQRRDIFGHVRKVAPVFHGRLKALEGHPLVGEADGVGLIGAVEMVADKASKRNFEAAKGVGTRCGQFCQDEGIIVRALINDRIALCPPLVITEAEIHEMFDRLERGLNRTLDWARREGIF